MKTKCMILMMMMIYDCPLSPSRYKKAINLLPVMWMRWLYFFTLMMITLEVTTCFTFASLSTSGQQECVGACLTRSIIYDKCTYSCEAKSQNCEERVEGINHLMMQTRVANRVICESRDELTFVSKIDVTIYDWIRPSNRIHLLLARIHLGRP